MKAWSRIDSGEDITKAGFRSVIHKQFRMNNGRVMQADVTSNEGSAAAGVIGLTEDNQVVIARQFRCGPEKVLEEMPGGLVDAHESPEQAARREFQEETGYEADSFEYLGHAYVNAWDNMKHHYFLARNCRQLASSAPEPNEEIEVDIISITEFIDNAKEGRMTDSQGVLLAYDKLKEIEGGL